MKLTDCNRWKVTSKADFDKFCVEAHDLGFKWASGEIMISHEMREVIYKSIFPQYFLLEFPYVYIDAPRGVARDYKPTKTIEKKSQKNEPGILVILPNGDETFYDLEDYEEVVKEAKKALAEPKFKIGDRVCVVKDKQYYDSYADWFEENNVPVKIAAKYAFNQEFIYDSESEVYEVLAVGKHQIGDGYLYAIQHLNSSFSPVYLFNEKGLSKIL